jgi:hypothetical protein
MLVNRVQAEFIGTNRIDPDYYRPEHLADEKHLRHFGSDELGTIGHFVAGPFGSKLPSDLYLAAGIPLFRVANVGSISQQDLRTPEGRQQLLKCDLPSSEILGDLNRQLATISGIGEKRFVRGILGTNSRTAAFNMNVQTPRMEPAKLVDEEGVVGFHYRSGVLAEPLLVQLLGNELNWTKEHLNELAGILMAATVQRDKNAVPVPFQLAQQQLHGLPQFLKQYCFTMRTELKNREIEDSWLSDLET